MPSEQQKALGERLAHARLTLGLSQDTIARRAGTTKALLAALETGSQSMTVDLLTTLADVLNTTVSQLMGEGRRSAIPAVCTHGRGKTWPETMLFGSDDLTWPVAVFTIPEHAYDWLMEKPDSRHVYHVSVTVIGEMRPIPPTRPAYEILPLETPDAEPTP